MYNIRFNEISVDSRTTHERSMEYAIEIARELQTVRASYGNWKKILKSINTLIYFLFWFLMLVASVSVIYSLNGRAYLAGSRSTTGAISLQKALSNFTNTKNFTKIASIMLDKKEVEIPVGSVNNFDIGIRDVYRNYSVQGGTLDIPVLVPIPGMPSDELSYPDVITEVKAEKAQPPSQVIIPQLPPPPRPMYAAYFNDIIYSDIAVISDKANLMGLNASVNVNIEKEFTQWTVYIQDANGLYFYNDMRLSKRGSFDNNEDAVDFAIRQEGVAVLKKEKMRRSRYSMSVCCSLKDDIDSFIAGLTDIVKSDITITKTGKIYSKDYYVPQYR